MIRFRRKEDERRYYALLSEVYRAVGAHLPPAVAQQTVRHLGKMQDLLLLEGVRQGTAAARIGHAALDQGDAEVGSLKAFQLHAHVYGSSDTPLVEMESVWLDRLDQGQLLRAHPWLDPEPMRFAPDTEEAWRAEVAAQALQTDAPLATHQSSPELPVREVTEPSYPQPTGDPYHDDLVRERTAWRHELQVDDTSLGESPDAQEHPELLDQIRECLGQLSEASARPANWQDLILRLHLMTQVDAGFLDLQLGTAMGRTVLDQAGFFDLRPGAFGTDLHEIETMARLREAPEDPSPSDAAPAARSSAEGD